MYIATQEQICDNYGNWNLHVCHEWKYEVDRHSRSTEVNPGEKQKWCSLSCLWFKFNGINLAKEFLKLWVVYGQNTIDVPISEIEQRCQLFPAGWEQSLLHISREICRLKRDTIGSQWNTDYLLEPPPPPKKKKKKKPNKQTHDIGAYQKLEHLDDAIFRVLNFGVSVFLLR